MLITDLWKNQKGDYFCVSSKSITKKWKETFFKRGQWLRVRKFIEDNLDKDLYMCPHGFSKPQRLKENSIDPCLLYADLDFADPRKVSIRPTIAIESSPGRYVGYWLTDKPASEELNRRLAYMIGADTSGWDRTQVLRIPTTRNYKYPSKPLVKTLWTDGPSYQIEALEKLIPEVKVRGNLEVENTAAQIYKEYETRLPRWVRRDLMTSHPTVGKRSEVLWKLHNALLEMGMTRDEAFQVLWVSPWNKFKDRRNGEDQLLKELDKALNQHFVGYKAEEKEESKWNPLPAPISQIESENIEWIIPKLIAKKEITIVEGDPGLGKSYLVQMLAGSVCDGTHIECLGKYVPVIGRVAYFDTENTASTVTRGRLDDNRIKNLKNYFQGEEGFSIDDPDKWEMVIERLEQLRPRLIVFDTINTYIGGTDTYRSSETQQAMAFFKELGTRFNCGVIILRHLTKGGKDKALYRGQGSIAFTGAARIVATVGRLPDDPDVRVVACTKNNISKPFKSFTYTIKDLPDTLKRSERSQLVWGDQVDLSSDDIISIVPNGGKNKDRDNAEEFIRTQLESEGKIEASKLFKMAESRSISKSTLTRASEQLGVVKELVGFGKNKKSYWSLPTSK